MPAIDTIRRSGDVARVVNSRRRAVSAWHDVAMKRGVCAGVIVPLLLFGPVKPVLFAPGPRVAPPAQSRSGRSSDADEQGSPSCPAAAPDALFQAPGIPGGGKTVALTFDDGPGPSTAAILSILESFHVPATFFNIGVEEEKWPDDVRAEAAAGYLIGDHTWNHPDMTLLSSGAQASELDEVVAEQRALVGSSPCVFRPPYGDYDAVTLGLASARHMATWLWDVDTEDWEAEGSSSTYWVDRIISLAEAEGGALSHPVVLMHNQAIAMPATVAALPAIIEFFESRGYTFVDLLGRSGPPMSCGSTPVEQPGTVLEPGSRLDPGSTITSPGGQFSLVMQKDGNLVMETSTGRPLWDTATARHPRAFAAMQDDGNFVVYSRSGRVLWSSGTAGHPGTSLSVQSDGNVIAEDASGPDWCAGAKDAELLAGERLEPAWSLESPTWISRLVMQPDGNLVLYSIGHSVMWSSGTRGEAGASASMQADGNFVVRSGSGRVVWASGTNGHPGARLVLSGSGPALILSPAGTVLSTLG